MDDRRNGVGSQQGESAQVPSEEGAVHPKGAIRRRTFVGVLIGAALAATSIPLFRRLFHRWKLEPPVEIALQGPFQVDEVFQLKGEKPSEYVEPQTLLFTPSVDMVSAHVRFLFKGEKSSQREITMTITLHDEQGSVLFEGTKRCRDQRVVAEESSEELIGTVGGTVFVWNAEKLRFDKDILGRAAKATVRFQEA